jgi:hypothetical protein
LEQFKAHETNQGGDDESICNDQGNGALKFLNKYPTGKGANWVEIVSFE